MPKCSYCGQNYEFPMGMTVVDSASSVVRYFCCNKCRVHSERIGKRRKIIKKKAWVTKF
jgi:ribosomal protein L24E